MLISLYIELEKRACNSKPLDRVMKEIQKEIHDKENLTRIAVKLDMRSFQTMEEFDIEIKEVY
tara:strand:- start:427 stop:615 length:189 start_codon:yes stop_codon:yes gene_type:complete